MVAVAAVTLVCLSVWYTCSAVYHSAGHKQTWNLAMKNELIQNCKLRGCNKLWNVEKTLAWD